MKVDRAAAIACRLEEVRTYAAWVTHQTMPLLRLCRLTCSHANTCIQILHSCLSPASPLVSMICSWSSKTHLDGALLAAEDIDPLLGIRVFEHDIMHTIVVLYHPLAAPLLALYPGGTPAGVLLQLCTCTCQHTVASSSHNECIADRDSNR